MATRTESPAAALRPRPERTDARRRAARYLDLWERNLAVQAVQAAVPGRPPAPGRPRAPEAR